MSGEVASPERIAINIIRGAGRSGLLSHKSWAALGTATAGQHMPDDAAHKRADWGVCACVLDGACVQQAGSLLHCLCCILKPPPSRRWLDRQ